MAQSKSSSHGAVRRKTGVRRKTAPLAVGQAVLVPETLQKVKMVPFTAARSETAYGTSKRNKIGGLSYLSVYRAPSLERISLIKQGVPAADVKRLLTDLNLGLGVGFKALNLSTATVNKKAKTGDLLSSEESERVIGLARLVGQLEAMVEASGDPSGFDANAWIARWLAEPLPAFGGARPLDLIDTMEGQGLVSSALAKLQSGAYA
jgi:putative toxin-antitoxin system antitoxin component (TIGR02293 family)